MNFLLLAASGLVLLGLTLRGLPETNRHRDPRATDLGPLLRNYARVASSRAFWAHALPVTGSYGALFCFISASSFLLIELFGISERGFGFVYALVTLGYLLGTVAVRRVLARLGLVGAIRLGDRRRADGAAGGIRRAGAFGGADPDGFRDGLARLHPAVLPDRLDEA